MAGKRLDRRMFLKYCGTTAVAGAFGFHSTFLPAQVIPQKRKERFKLSRPEWIIYENGSYDLISNEIVLKNCRPAINGQGVMPKNVFLGDSPKGKRIVYELSGGFLMLDLKTNRNSLSIGAELSGFSTAPRWFYPISQAEVSGANFFLRQCYGTGGKSSVISLNHGLLNAGKPQTWSYDSFMAFAFFGNKETVAIGNGDQRDFFHRSTIYNKPHTTGFKDEKTVDEQVFFESAMLLEEVPIENEYIKLPDLYFYAGNYPMETLRELVWKQSDETGARQGTSASYHLVGCSDNKNCNSFQNLREQIEHLSAPESSVPVQTIMIDSGYCIVGDWLKPNENWPGGLDRAAREIFKNGYRPGIWIAPFLVSEKSEVFTEHPEWLAKDYDDQPIVQESDGEEVLYALDVSHPEALNYLVKVFKSLHKSGFIFYETAYLDAGFKDSVEIKRNVPRQSSVQAFRNALYYIRKEIGPGSLVMANHTPFAPVIGFADIVKTRNDVKNKLFGNNFENSIHQSYLAHYMNNILWQNESGDVCLPIDAYDLNEVEKQSLTLWCGILGGAVGTSVNITRLSEEEKDILRFLEPNQRFQNASLISWPQSEQLKIAVRYYRPFKSWGVLFLNDTEKPVSKKYFVYDLIDESAVYVYGWKPQPPIYFGELQEISVHLEPHESRLFYFSKNNEPPPENLTLGGKIAGE